MKVSLAKLVIVFLALFSKGLGLSTSGNSHTWKGYSPACATECQKVGDVCDTGKETICCMKGQCNKKYNLNTCSSPLVSFTCDPVPQDDLIKTVINPKLYPNLYNKP